MAEMTLEQRRKPGKKTRHVTVFRGICILVKPPKPRFQGHTVLVRDKVDGFDWLNESALGLTRADMVDIVFEKKYDVFTSDQVEARYLIHPAAIERINNLAVSGQAATVMMSYYKGSVLIMLPSQKKFFEPPDLQAASATDTQSILAIKRELTAVLGLVDELELLPQKACV
jgi:hypothetical protein